MIRKLEERVAVQKEIIDAWAPLLERFEDMERDNKTLRARDADLQRELDSWRTSALYMDKRLRAADKRIAELEEERDGELDRADYEGGTGRAALDGRGRP